MKKLILRTLVLFFSPLMLLSQNHSSQSCNRDTCVAFMYRDQATLKRIVLVKYSSNKILIPIGEKSYGYGTSEENVIIPARYDIGKPFCNGYAVVSINKKLGIIDSLGKLIVPLKYTSLSDVHEGFAFFSRKGDLVDGVVDMNGKEYSVDPLIGALPVKTNQSVITSEYSDKGSFIHDDIILLPYKFSEGLAVLNNKVINTDFKYVFTSTYKIEDCINGMLRVSWKSSTGNTLYGFLNKDGVLAVKPIYLSAENFVDGKSMVTSGNPINPVKKIIDKKGVILKIVE